LGGWEKFQKKKKKQVGGKEKNKVPKKKKDWGKKIGKGAGRK
jgi:hypothetical protein